MARLNRRAFITVVGVAVGGIVVSVSAAELLLSDAARSAMLERLGARSRSVGEDLLELGRLVNEASPTSAQRSSHLAVAEPEGPFATVLVDAARSEPSEQPVVIDGWLLPDLVAGVAGAIALETND